MHSWPSHRAITEQSTPACRSSIAAVCLKMCGDTRLDFNDGHLSLATRTYLASSAWTLSALSRPPCTLGNNAFASYLIDSLSHALRASRACLVSGVHRSLRPLPTHRTWAPAPGCMASLSRSISSERRNPV